MILECMEIEEQAITETVIQKSRFIGILSPVQMESEALEILGSIRRQHRDARHHCYAYRIGQNVMRYCDDGEPQGTAGMPMLEVLKQSGLTNVLMVCVRYFGGVLLGAGGLTRAYAGSTAQTVRLAKKLKISYADAYHVNTTYPVWSKLEAFFNQRSISIEKVTYEDSVSAIVFEPEGQNLIARSVSEISNGTAHCEYDGRKTVKTPLIDDKG